MDVHATQISSAWPARLKHYGKTSMVSKKQQPREGVVKIMCLSTSCTSPLVVCSQVDIVLSVSGVTSLLGKSTSSGNIAIRLQQQQQTSYLSCLMAMRSCIGHCGRTFRAISLTHIETPWSAIMEVLRKPHFSTGKGMLMLTNSCVCIICHQGECHRKHQKAQLCFLSIQFHTNTLKKNTIIKRFSCDRY